MAAKGVEFMGVTGRNSCFAGVLPEFGESTPETAG